MLLKDERELTPTGTHTAILYSIIDLGSRETAFGTKRKLRFAWELCDELMKSGKPFSVAKSYTRSLNSKSALAQDLKSLLGAPVGNSFQADSLLGMACNVTVTHEVSTTGEAYATVSSITPLKKGEKHKPQVNPNMIFSLEPSEYKEAVLESLPDYFREEIKKTPEYKIILDGPFKAKESKAVPVSFNDEIPY